jgi:hypothetical protein
VLYAKKIYFYYCGYEKVIQYKNYKKLRESKKINVDMKRLCQTKTIINCESRGAGGYYLALRQSSIDRCTCYVHLHNRLHMQKWETRHG